MARKRGRKKGPKAARRNPPNPRRPDLRFGPGDLSGFTAAGIAGFHALNPATVVRELLQNSLDAAREAGRDVARVRFEVEEREINSVPGIESYRAAFEKAKRDQTKRQEGKLQDTAIGIVRAMEDCLKSGERETLFVLDNGVGLDNRRTSALLGDGLSAKSDAATGAVGNGHLTVLPASDLRYVLYGGRTEDGEIIGAGHAVLASHQQGGECKSKDGFYVKDIRSDFFEPFVFPRDAEVPDYVKAKLEWIAANWAPGAGAVVAVPGFNHFREEGAALWDVVTKAAACNFFAAFARGELRVELREDGEEKSLDGSNVASTLKRFSEEKRTRGGFLSGSRAFAAFETIRQGQDASVDTGIGRISLRWRELPQGGLSRVDLCRNGMWVTDDPPRLGRHRFAEFRPFHCVILLDANDGEIHRLVRKAEGPLHNSLEVKNLPKEEKAALAEAMKAVSSRLREIVPKHDAEEFEIEDFMAIDSSGLASGGRRPGVVGRFGEARRRPRFPDESGGGGRKGRSGPGPATTRKARARAEASTPTGGGAGLSAARAAPFRSARFRSPPGSAPAASIFFRARKPPEARRGSPSTRAWTRAAAPSGRKNSRSSGT